MLTTIEVEIDHDGRIRPLEPLPFPLRGRAFLTLAPDASGDQPGTTVARATAADALSLLASPRFSRRPVADPKEVKRRIEELREDWEQD